MLKRSPIKRKRATPRRGPIRDAAYLEWIRTLPCLVCVHYESKQTRHTESCHVGLRGMGQRSSDRETVPLCGDHHRTGSTSHHVIGKTFWEWHGLVGDAIVSTLNARYEREQA